MENKSKAYIGLIVSFLAFFTIQNQFNVYGATSAVDEFTVTVPAACTMSTTVNSNHTATVEVGSYVDDIGETTFKVICNDAEGFSVYAVGYSGDAFGNTTMKPSTVADTNAIATGLATSGDTSNWAMKLTAVTGDYAPTLETGFNAYHEVPAEYTKVASYSSNTDSSSGSSFKSTYAAFVASAQPADTYTGKVKYTVIHPANADAPGMGISDLTYMQDFKNLTAAQRASVLNSMEYNTTYNLIDNRDNKTYQVARLKDGNIWMAENLDLGRTELTQDLTTANTNLLSNSASVTASTFNTWIKASDTSSFDTAELVPLTTSNSSDGLDADSTLNTSYGTLYNYCAASAGTICIARYYNDYDATSDICPAGWRLPTSGDSGEFVALNNLPDYSTHTGMHSSIANGGAAFALSGYFFNSNMSSQGSVGWYWSSTKYGGTDMYNLVLSGSSDPNPDASILRNMGLAVRCLVKNPQYLTVSYGTGVSSIKVNGLTISDGETIEVKEGFTYSIAMIPSDGYRFTSWSIESGTIGSTSDQTTVYTAGNGNATITASASYINAEIMQNLSSGSCTTSASYAKDNRDGHVYVIQRLADGKCWMMENLDLGRTLLTTDLTSSNTNVTNTVTAATFNSWRKLSISSTYTGGELISIDGKDSTAEIQYGTLYNYCAASAGTICMDGSSNTSDATNDICPAGWRLPTGGSSGEFKALYDLPDYNSNGKMRASVADGGLAFAFAGSFYDYALNSQNGRAGHYWSSTRNSSGAMYELYLELYQGNLAVTPASFNNRYYAQSVRCVSDI